MKTPKAVRYLLDVNVFVSLTVVGHVHHAVVKAWFNSNPGLQWALCAFTEAGFIRTVTAPRAGQLTMGEATVVLAKLQEHAGYSYLPITADWHTLCGPFFNRLYGTKQVTDAYLLGLAVRENLVLATLDKAIIHLAAEHRSHVLLLPERARER